MFRYDVVVVGGGGSVASDVFPAPTGTTDFSALICVLESLRIEKSQRSKTAKDPKT